METKDILDLLLGQTGGVYALGLISGAVAALRYIAPRMYEPKFASMQAQIDALLAEIKPYHEFKNEQIAIALDHARNKK